MALIKCPECGTEVSDKAATCPKCAYPMESVIAVSGNVKENSQEVLVRMELIENYLKNNKIKSKYICTSCGHIGSREEKSHFSCLICLLLACLFIIPAIIYGIWASSTKWYVCRKCKNKSLIPITSDNGRKLALEKEPRVFEDIIKTL